MALNHYWFKSYDTKCTKGKIRNKRQMDKIGDIFDQVFSSNLMNIPMKSRGTYRYYTLFQNFCIINLLSI